MANIIEPIKSAAPKTSLLTASRPIRTTGTDGTLREGWARGEWPDAITWIPDCPLPEAMGTFPKCRRVENCVSGDAMEEDDKPSAEPGESPYFVPFWVTAGSKCTATGSLTAAAHAERAGRLLNAGQAAQIAAVLETGLVNGAPVCHTVQGRTFLMPSLASAAVVSNAVGPPYDGSNLRLVLSGLLEDMEACGQYDVTFHLPRKMLPIALNSNVGLELRGDTWFLMGEYPAVFGPGYTGTGPVDLPAQPPGVGGFEIVTQGPDPNPGIHDAETDETWVYATGPIERAVAEWTLYRGVRHDGQSTPIDGQTDDFALVRQNFVEVIAERLVVFRFDICCVRAALTLVAEAA